ncbi:tRNA pseudouridine synthase A-like isoform X2 [Lytechinus variegatus]|uniref:tRNA pseudouridine synthase A-like isoform X2 n=1 Tax=Lytechinus variegatus TaxID=7654 RepID=UPI001BB240AC|nr:tRNA pseudouridine synthase A-like isoform X2 [Lytechinus variegatus]XP_041476590.1 tRNA pseudouridine synthase A-like isoform X2 [Lytechinus variegatus]XP_041476592.1 tRNA pseudouridine synthase A-like isoform X3 [Lytechinus variegatus]XP_041476593.1 tRNA pseudouridine synthase A-like isoform X2 [Lytechinus variegatus]
MIRRTLTNLLKSAASSLKMADAVPVTTALSADGGGTLVSARADDRKRAADNLLDDKDSKIQKTEDTVSSTVTNGGSEGQKRNKVLKRKVAILLSYAGANYVGMQRNPGVQTIEEDLVNALVKSGAIPEDCGRNMNKMSFQRCARTDKGVSAAGQVVSLKLLMLDNLVDKINEHLPPVIRVMDVVRTTGGFNCKNNCEFRTYMYLLPTFSFTPLESFTEEKYRVTDEKIEEVNEQLKKYIGTHNFHNFTSGKAYKDPSANRYIKEFTCEKGFVDDGLEFAVIKVKGQSFMLHQIRKMIGLVLAVVRGLTPPSTIERAFEEPKLDIPRAPGLGLVLEAVHYDCYNRRWGSDGLHEPLTFEHSKDKIEAFKHKHIYPNIIVREKYNKSMFQWLTTLPLHTYDVVGTRNPLRVAHTEMKAAIENQGNSSSSSIEASNTDKESAIQAELKERSETSSEHLQETEPIHCEGSDTKQDSPSSPARSPEESRTETLSTNKTDETS